MCICPFMSQCNGIYWWRHWNKAPLQFLHQSTFLGKCGVKKEAIYVIYAMFSRHIKSQVIVQEVKLRRLPQSRVHSNQQRICEQNWVMSQLCLLSLCRADTGRAYWVLWVAGCKWTPLSVQATSDSACQNGTRTLSSSVFFADWNRPGGRQV